MTATPESEGPAGDAGTTRQAIRDGIDDAYSRAGKAAHDVAERTRDGIDQARDAVNDAYASTRDRASQAYASAREKARSAGQTAADGLEGNPLVVLAGGIAIGAVIGALLPRSEREAKVLGEVGERVRSATREAIEAAKDAGRDKLDELGLNRDHARDTMKSLIDGVIAAAGSAGTAAVERARTASSEKKD